MANTTPLGRVFTSNDALSRLQDHAARLVRLQRAIECVIPRPMHRSVGVANFEEGTLVLHAQSATVASRLKMLEETLKADLLARGEAVMGIKVRVRPVQAAPSDPMRALAPRQVTPEGRRALDELREKLDSDSPLGRALQKMLKDSA